MTQLEAVLSEATVEPERLMDILERAGYEVVGLTLFSKGCAYTTACGRVFTSERDPAGFIRIDAMSRQKWLKDPRSKSPR